MVREPNLGHAVRQSVIIDYKRKRYDSPLPHTGALSPSTKNTTAMMTMKNKVQLMGNLGRDPELKDLGNGQFMLKLSIATNERFRSGEGEWKEDTQWHPVVAWGKQAQRLAGQVTKGSALIIEGRLVHRTYEAKSGEKRYSTEVVLSDYHLVQREPKVAEMA